MMHTIDTQLLCRHIGCHILVVVLGLQSLLIVQYVLLGPLGFQGVEVRAASSSSFLVPAPRRGGNIELHLLPSLFSSSSSAFLCFLELAAAALDWGKVEGL